MKLGRRIAAYRKLDGLTAKQLAEMVGNGLTPSTLASIESGRRKDVGVSTVVGIAYALRIPLISLLFPLESPESNIGADHDTGTVQKNIGWILGGKHDPSDDAAMILANSVISALRVIAASNQRCAQAQLELALLSPKEDRKSEAFLNEQIEREKEIMFLSKVVIDDARDALSGNYGDD